MLLTLAGTLFAQEGEFVFTSLIADKEAPAVSEAVDVSSPQGEEELFSSLVVEPDALTEPEAVDASSPQGEEELFSSLVVEPAALTDPPHQPVVIPTPVQPVATPAQPVAAPALSIPKKHLRDPFWPVGYIPDAWKEKVVEVDLDALASLNEQWGAAAAKIKVSFTKMVNGKRVASIGRQIKRPGDTIEIQHAGRTFEFKLGTVYANGKLGLKKGRIY